MTRKYLPVWFLPVLWCCAAALAGCATATGGAGAVSVAPSRMIETGDLAEVTQAALHWSGLLGSDQVMVVYDLDNTLLAMEQDLGSDQWYDWQKSIAAKHPCDERLVSGLLAVQGGLYYASAMRLTQADAPAQVRALQDAGMKVFVLSSRGADFRLQTFRELRRAGLRFYPSAIGPLGGYAEAFVPPGGKRPALYEDGVFLTAGQHKGAMLQALLEITGTPAPALIFMVDDKAYNLQYVLDSFVNTTTSVQAYRYNREDPVLRRFDAHQAADQWQLLLPALQQMQQLFGADNFDIPDQAPPADCEAGME